MLSIISPEDRTYRPILDSCHLQNMYDDVSNSLRKLRNVLNSNSSFFSEDIRIRPPPSIPPSIIFRELNRNRNRNRNRKDKFLFIPAFIIREDYSSYSPMMNNNVDSYSSYSPRNFSDRELKAIIDSTLNRLMAEAYNSDSDSDSDRMPSCRKLKAMINSYFVNKMHNSSLMPSRRKLKTMINSTLDRFMAEACHSDSNLYDFLDKLDYCHLFNSNENNGYDRTIRNGEEENERSDSTDHQVLQPICYNSLSYKPQDYQDAIYMKSSGSSRKVERHMPSDTSVHQYRKRILGNKSQTTQQKVIQQKPRTRALLDGDEVLILGSNEKFLAWKIPSVVTLRNKSLSCFQLFRLDYLKTLLSRSTNRSIRASKLNKINAEIIEAWNGSEKVRESYRKLSVKAKAFFF